MTGQIPEPMGVLFVGLASQYLMLCMVTKPELQARTDFDINSLAYLVNCANTVHVTPALTLQFPADSISLSAAPISNVSPSK